MAMMKIAMMITKTVDPQTVESPLAQNKASAHLAARLTCEKDDHGDDDDYNNDDFDDDEMIKVITSSAKSFLIEKIQYIVLWLIFH